MALIDYFTTIAQIINFLVLVFLLRHFLYRPVIKAMDEREQKIASRLKDAEEKRKVAEQDEASYRKMKQEMAVEHDAMIAKATEEVQAFRADLIKKAREDVDKTKEDWYEAFQRQKDAFLADVAAQAGREVYAVSRHALKDLADEELERRIIDAFLKRLENADAYDKDRLRSFYEKLKPKGDQRVTVTVKSTFQIPDEARNRFQEILQRQSGSNVKIQYEIDQNLISGIELRSNDMKISWSIASYLDDLENDLSRVLEQKVGMEKAG
ncbi:MAG: F0F1 ATP synthase subunit delta [Methanotrichaceae archaeon]